MTRSGLAQLLRAAADALHPEPGLTIERHFAAGRPGKVLDWSEEIDAIQRPAPRWRTRGDSFTTDSEPSSPTDALAERLRAQVTVAFQSLPVIEINADSTDAERELAELRSRLEAFASKSVGVDIGADSALIEMTQIGKQLAFLGRRR